MGYALAFAALIAVSLLLAVGCSNLPNEATSARLLQHMGYSDVQYTGRSPFAELHGCSDKDVAVLHFRVVNPAHQRTTIDTCQGWPLGGAHIRGQ